MPKKKEFNKSSIFDRCVGGKYSNYRELLNEGYDQFTVAYAVCKSIGEDNIKDIEYKGLKDDNVLQVDIECKSTVNIDNLECNHKDKNTFIDIDQDDDIIHLNISINGGGL